MAHPLMAGMAPDTPDMTLHFLSADAEREAAKVRKKMMTTMPEGMGTMMRLSEGSSLRGTVFNLVNTMIGGGILGLPYATQELGLALGCGLLFLFAALTDLAAWMLLVSVDATREKSYAMVAEVLFNRYLGLLVDVTVALNNLGVLISYLMIIGDVVPPFMAHIGAPEVLQGRTSLLTLATVFVLLPMSSMRNMGALRHTSFVCLFMIGVLAVIIVAMGSGWIDVSQPTDGPMALFSQDVPVILGQMPVLVFAYNCAFNVPILYGELRRQKHEATDSKFQTKRAKMMAGMHISVALCAVIYGSVAAFGYGAFRQRTEHDILTNLSAQSFGPAPYVKAAYSVVMICSYPVICFSCVASLHRLLLHGKTVLYQERTPVDGGLALFMASSPAPSPLPSPSSSPRMIWSGEDVSDLPLCEACPKRPDGAERLPRSQPPPPGWTERQAEVVGILLATLGLGVLLPDVSVVFGLTGGLCGGALTYVFPALFYIQTTRRVEFPSLRRLPGPWLGHAMLWLGIVISIGSTAVVAWQTAIGAS